MVIICLSLTPHITSAQPKLTIPDSIFDFGYVPQNSEISHVFWLHSTGSETLKILNVKPGCGCTKAPLDKEALVVGDSTRLEVIYSTRKYSGRQSKRPTITTNEGELPKYVQFTANVIVNPDSTYPIRIKPYKFDVSQFGEKTVNSREFIIENVSDSDIDIALVDMPLGMFTIKLPRRVKAGQTEKGIITLSRDYIDKEFEKSLTIELNDEAKTRFTVPVKRTLRVPGGTPEGKAAAQNPSNKSTAQSGH
jgi:hypothetical protein